jgi:cephalosporin-C deacetylase-like acetyl esterase
LQDVAIPSTDGIQLHGWFLRPKRSVGDAVMLFHGIGDNREGMLSLAEFFLSHGYSVLLPDSRGLEASGGFPTYGIRERNDIR